MTTGDDQQQDGQGISHRDWSAEAESRVQRWSLAAPRPAAGRMVLSRLAALRPISQASPTLARSLATPLPLVLRMLPRQAAEPMMTIQSPSPVAEPETYRQAVLTPQPAAAPSPEPEASQAYDENDSTPPEVDTPEPPPASPSPPTAEVPSTSLLGSAIGALRRVFRRPDPIEVPPAAPEPAERPSSPSPTPTATVSRQEHPTPARESDARETSRRDNQASLSVEDSGAARRQSTTDDAPATHEPGAARMPASPSPNLVLRQTPTENRIPDLMRSAAESSAPSPIPARLESTAHTAPSLASAPQPTSSTAPPAPELPAGTPPQAAPQALTSAALTPEPAIASPAPLTRSEAPAPLDSFGRARESEQPDEARADIDEAGSSPLEAPGFEAPRPRGNRLMLSLRRLFDGDRDRAEEPASAQAPAALEAEPHAKVTPSPMANPSTSAPLALARTEAPLPTIDASAPTVRRAMVSEEPAAEARGTAASPRLTDSPSVERRPQLTLRQSPQQANIAESPQSRPEPVPTQSIVEAQASTAQPVIAPEEARRPAEKPALADTIARTPETPSAIDATRSLPAFSVEDQDEGPAASPTPGFEAPSISRFTLARRESTPVPPSMDPLAPFDTTSEPVLRVSNIPPRPDESRFVSLPTHSAEVPAPAQRVRTGIDPVVLRSMQARPYEPPEANSSDAFAPVARRASESSVSSPASNDSSPSMAAWASEQRQSYVSTNDASTDDASFTDFEGMFSGFSRPSTSPERASSIARAPLSLVYRAARPAGADASFGGNSMQDPMASLDQWVAAAEMGSGAAARPVFAGASAMQTLSASPSMIHRQIGDEAGAGEGAMAESAGAAPSAESPAAPAEEGAAQGPSLESLAQEVYERLRRRLIVERERSGTARAYA